MTDSRDQSEFEIVDYKTPKPSTAPMGFNSAVIKPETRVNKAEDVEENVSFYPLSCDKPDQPNQSLMIISEIEGLVSQVNERLEKLDGGHYACVKAVKKGQALEEIDLFQKTTLFELRKAFECKWIGTIGESNCDGDYPHLYEDDGRLRCPE